MTFRSRFRAGVTASALALAVASTAQTQEAPAAGALAEETLAYVGTYTRGASQGIYLFRLEVDNPEVSQNVLLVPLGLAAEAENPSFLEIDAQRRLVFAVNEVEEFAGQPSGAVSAFASDPTTGRLELINQRASGGAGPCHLALDQTGRYVLVANYGGGSAAVLPVAPDGRLGEATDFVQHAGSSVDPQRQEGPHAHCVTVSPDNRFVFVCDLGLDKVMAYRFNAEEGKLAPSDPPFATVAPGAGPRHMAFRPDGKYAYVINELNSTITAFAYDRNSGRLAEVQTISTLPEFYDGSNTTAEIDVHPSGKFLYASNRGRNSVVLFTIDDESGALAYVEEKSTGGQTPRHFGIQPSGDHLAIANQGTNTLLLCRVDGDNGRLKPSGVFAEAPTPVCIKFLPPQGQ
jgi:6-phosphogluconolactonase